jgi:hypothetical protein
MEILLAELPRSIANNLSIEPIDEAALEYSLEHGFIPDIR